MPEPSAALIAIIMMAAITYLTRIGGYHLARWVGRSEEVRAVLAVLPGCAIASVVAPAVARGSIAEMVILAAAGAIFYRTDRLLLAIAFAVSLLVLAAHLGL